MTSVKEIHVPGGSPFSDKQIPVSELIVESLSFRKSLAKDHLIPQFRCTFKVQFLHGALHFISQPANGVTGIPPQECQDLLYSSLVFRSRDLIPAGS